MEDAKQEEKVAEKPSSVLQQNTYFAVFSYEKEFTMIKSNCTLEQSKDLQVVLSQRLEKGIMYPEVGTVLTVDWSPDTVESEERYGCYYYSVNVGASAFTTEQDGAAKYIICFLFGQEQALELFRMDLDKYCSEILKPLKSLEISASSELPATLVVSLENWYTVAIEYLMRCKQALGESLKFLIYSALVDKQLVLIGGTAELQADIYRFYDACSLSDILSQLRETRQRREAPSLSGSVDMLIDVESQQNDEQSTLTVSITADSVRLDSNGCNKFCEEWANTINRPEFLDQPIKQKQVIEAFKLKFIQTMNTLKRLLREAENDYYALYRSYVFLRDSGNCEILLHYVTTEGAIDTTNILSVLQDFIQEQEPI